MSPRGFITGVAGPALAVAEAAFLREAQPWGLILFDRNIHSPDEVRRLVSSFREAVGRAGAPVLVDQEGGRVQRLKQPHLTRCASARGFGVHEYLVLVAGIDDALLCAR